MQPQLQASYYGSTTAPLSGGQVEKRKQRVNYVGIAASLILPWIQFTAIFGLLSFSMHYKHGDLCWFIIALMGVFTLLCGGMAFKAFRRRQMGDPMREPTWFIFLFLTLAVAWVLGVIMGNKNFSGNMTGYYDMTNLNTYPGVDPSKVEGQQVMDAGRIMFTRGSKLDISRSIGFKDGSTYCVAPIIYGNVPITTYDFWAVGVNCCSSDERDFHCGQFDNQAAHGGLRLMNEGQVHNFELAVEQAKAAYKIEARHPLFFHWMEDPISEVNAGQDAGLQYYILGTLCFFAFQLFIVILASIGFAKLGTL